ncbi:DNA protecting DprA domain protein [Mycobacterium xenopi 3993]|nr:DNA protecting DprA domain protein [Mycobacterium xenopi 3993]
MSGFVEPRRPCAHNTIGVLPCGLARTAAPPNAAKASTGHSSSSGVISRPPRRRRSSRSAAAWSISRLASVCRASLSLTWPRRTRSAASTAPTR